MIFGCVENCCAHMHHAYVFEANKGPFLVLTLVQDSSLGRTTRKVEIEDERRNNLLSIMVRTNPATWGGVIGTVGRFVVRYYSETPEMWHL